MGTRFFVDEMFPAVDEEARKADGRERQVEMFRSTAQEVLCLRIGRLGEQHMGRGSCVELDREGAQLLLDGLQAAMGFLSWK